MSKDDFSREEFADRHRRVRARMAEAGIELLIVIHPTNIQYLIGTRTKSYQEFQCLLFPLDPASPMVVEMRLAEVAEYQDLSLADHAYGWGGREPEDPIAVLRRIMEKHGYLKRRIGLEVPYYYLGVHDHAKLRALFPEAVEATSLIEQLKFVKSPAEIAYIRKAAGIVEKAMHIGLEQIREGVAECELAGTIYGSLLNQGGDSPASPMNIVTGERACYPHGAPTDRRMKKGDAVNVEFGGAYRRYCVTIGRQLSIGKPPARHQEIYDVVREACDACIDKMRPGARAVDAHNAAKKVIADAGYDQYRLHTTGYGIAPGYPPSWGESIHMFGDSEYVLEAGMMLSVEPPIYIHEERLGVRLIDDVLITEKGPEILTPYLRDLTVR